MISGYLFYKGLEEWKWDKWQNKIMNRVYSLLVPYIIWICLYALFNQSIPSLTDFWCSQRWNIDRLDFWGNPNIATAPLLVPMWFIRDLMVCILLTPLFQLILRKESPKILTIIFLFIISLLYFSQTSLRIPGLTSSSIFYFSLGAYLSLHEMRMECLMSSQPIKYTVYFITLIFMIFEVLHDGHNTKIGDYVYPFYVVAGVFSIIGIFQSMINSTRNVSCRVIHFCEANSSACFFIFASHIFILPFVKQVLIKLVSVSTQIISISNFLKSTIVYFGTILLTTLTCVLIYKFIINRYHIVSKLLCGK